MVGMDFPSQSVLSSDVQTDTDRPAGVVGCFSTYATVFPSKAFGVLNIMFTIFMIIMYVLYPAMPWDADKQVVHKHHRHRSYALDWGLTWYSKRL